MAVPTAITFVGGPYLSSASSKAFSKYIEIQARIGETSPQSSKRAQRQAELAQHLASCLRTQRFGAFCLAKNGWYTDLWEEKP